MLKRLFSIMAAIALAAAVAFYLVVPQAGDEEASVMAERPEAAHEPSSDDEQAAIPEEGTTQEEERSGQAPAGTRDLDEAAGASSFDDDGGLREQARFPSPAEQPRRPSIQPIELSELPFDAQCGLQLSRIAQDPVLFASGVSLDPNAGGPAAMRFDDELVLLTRSGVDGEPLGFGQFSRQLYQDETGEVSVILDLAVEPSEYTDRSAVTRGELTVMSGSRPVDRFEVSGSAGC